MSLDINYFRAIQGSLECNNEKDIKLAELKNNYIHNFDSSIGVEYDTLKNGVSQNFIIITTKDPHICTIKARADEKLSTGDIIDYHGGKWIVADMKNGLDICYEGIIRQCNFKLCYQNGNSIILEQWCLITDTYAEVSSNGKVITTPIGKTVIQIPYNNNTKMLYKDKRIMLEKVYDGTGKEIGTVYKITGFDGKTTDYGNGKLITLTIESDSFSDKDNLVQMVCDYIEPTPSPIPSPDLLNCIINGTPTIRMGGTARTLTALFYKSDGITIDDTIIPVWNVDISDAYASNIHSSQNGNSISIWTDDINDIIGQTITISVVDSNGLYNSTSKILEVV